MLQKQSLVVCAVLSLFLAQPIQATTVTLNVDFESPAFTTGSVAGQNGWGIFSPSFPETISTAQAHGGTQSLYTDMPSPYNQPLGSGAIKSLDPATQGEYPSASVTFPIAYGTDWWAQTWVRVTSGGTGATMMLKSGLTSWYVTISGSGTPILETAIPATPPATLANQGANVLDQWVLLRMAHTVSMGQNMELSILGDNVNLTSSRYYTSPGPYMQYLVLSGDAYWDDVMVGTGIPPTLTAVPLPASIWLFSAGVGVLGLWRRKV